MLDNPRWLAMLFNLFMANYKSRWSDFIQSEALKKANEFMWLSALKGFDENLIMNTAMEVIKHYDYPPSIQQFLSVLTAKQRNESLETNSKRLLGGGNFSHSISPPSPLLAEYMRKNPLKIDDPFKSLFERYKGEELGTKVIEEIKRRLGGKCANSKRHDENKRDNVTH